MECAVIVTYRCNAHCKMCHTWKYPSQEHDEFPVEILTLLPGGQHRINLTGGEPALREDLLEVAGILVKKTPRLEISTNGFYTEKLVEVGRKYPQVTFRISVEGLPKLNDQVRGLKDGFDHALRTVLSLLEVGVEDVGFGMVVSDKNAHELMPIYQLCSRMGIEFATSTMHNSFYFHKENNRIDDIEFVESRMKEFISGLLRSRRSNLKLKIKDWGRAFINLGILRQMLGGSRPLPCGAAQDLFFLDPYGRILACNGSAEPWVLGDLKHQTFDQIWNSTEAIAIRLKVRECRRKCWMVGTAVPAMRRNPWVPFLWITKNKLRLARGQKIYLS